MKQRHIINAVDDEYVTCKCVFVDGVDVDAPLKTTINWGSCKKYTFKAHKSLELKDGDRAIVAASGALTVVTVIQVDEEPDIDWDAEFDYKWIVQKIDFTLYQALLERDANFRKKLEKVEVANKREQVLAAFGLTGADLKPLLELKQ